MILGLITITVCIIGTLTILGVLALEETKQN